MTTCCLCNKDLMCWLIKTKIGEKNKYRDYLIMIMERVCQACMYSFEYNERIAIYHILSKFKDKYAIREDFDILFSVEDFQREIPDLKMAIRR